MNKIGLIIKREYMTRVRKRSFLILTFLGPILMAAIKMGARKVRMMKLRLRTRVKYSRLMMSPILFMRLGVGIALLG